MSRNTSQMLTIIGLACGTLAAQEPFTETQLQILRKNSGARPEARLAGGHQARLAAADRRTAAASAEAAVPRATDSFDGDIIMPVILNGRYGRGTMATAVRIVNTSNAPVDLAIEFFNRLGRSVEVPIAADDGTRAGNYDSLWGTLAGESAAGFFTYPDSPDIQAVSARIHSYPAGALRVMVTPTYLVGDFWLAAGTLAPERPTRQSYYLLGDNERSTTFHVLNTSGRSTTVTLRSLTMDGSEMCRSYEALGAGQTLMFNPATENSCMRAMAVQGHILSVSASSPVLAIDNYSINSSTFQVYPAYPGQ